MKEAITVSEFETLVRRGQIRGYAPLWCPHCGIHLYAVPGEFECPACLKNGHLSFDDNVGLKVVKS